jgi:hypothetical protein
MMGLKVQIKLDGKYLPYSISWEGVVGKNGIKCKATDEHGNYGGLLPKDDNFLLVDEINIGKSLFYLIRYIDENDIELILPIESKHITIPEDKLYTVEEIIEENSKEIDEIIEKFF